MEEEEAEEVVLYSYSGKSFTGSPWRAEQPQEHFQKKTHSTMIHLRTPQEVIPTCDTGTVFTYNNLFVLSLDLFNFGVLF